MYEPVRPRSIRCIQSVSDVCITGWKTDRNRPKFIYLVRTDGMTRLSFRIENLAVCARNTLSVHGYQYSLDRQLDKPIIQKETDQRINDDGAFGIDHGRFSTGTRSKDHRILQ